MDALVVFWFRRDLRLEDNHGLYQALLSGYKVLPLFIFDPENISRHSENGSPQLKFVIGAVEGLKQDLVGVHSDLLIFYDSPSAVFARLIETYPIVKVYANEEYEPKAIQRDEEVKRVLANHQVEFYLYDDHLIFKPGSILKSDNAPYVIFTPFAKKWRQMLSKHGVADYSIGNEYRNLIQMPISVFDFSVLGVVTGAVPRVDCKIPSNLIATYDQTRNIPSLVHGTSHLGVCLRFGVVSIRRLVAHAKVLNDPFLNQLIWREFFMHILFHFPYVTERSFRKAYDAIVWRNNEEEFERWCNGLTGVPLVDAGMRELNQTGFMHNRVRMVTASYLAKLLLIDWRWGEAYFAQKLLDFELSANNGNWQWVAGCGCDAAPYFRVFNPYRQQERFDPGFEYIARWVPEYQSEPYRKLVKMEFSEAKGRCLETYKRAIQGD